jgi:hypothetical protein
MKSWTHKQGGVFMMLLLILGLSGCKTAPVASSNYSPNEFTLLLATSNEGEVGPCG